MDLASLKSAVKIKVDEYTPSGVSHSFDDYLEPMLKEAARNISMEGPKWLLDPADIPTSSTKYDNEIAYIPVPTDFARLFVMKFPQWEKSVYDIMSTEHPDQAIQENEFIRAGYGRPVVMLKEYDPDGSSLARYLACAKVLRGALPEAGRYIAYKEPADMPAVLDEALTWLAASKLLQIMEYFDGSKAALANYQAEITQRAR